MMEEIKLSNSKRSGNWRANIGEVALNLLEKKGLSSEECNNVLNESIDILENCGNPENETNSKTGLVIGYVQSGKTLSFTTLAALAAQNGFNIIIVIAGITDELVKQTNNRLAEDLNVNISVDVSWKQYTNPHKDDRKVIISDLKPGILNENPVVLITVMKNSTHLSNLNKLFSEEFDNSKNRVLIIDDEADQASLNTKAKKNSEIDVSKIYSLIRKMKSIFTNHTYVQYTATPQAPLFISLLDILSPSFVKILTPGVDYIGGKDFFKRNKSSKYLNVLDIPKDEIYSEKNQINRIPNSLVNATIFFMITVAIGALNKEKPQTHNRTMMVHPSVLKKVHSVYLRWLKALKKRCLEEFEFDDNDIDKIKLIDEFKSVYEELYKISNAIPEFDEIIKHIPYLIGQTHILLSNSDAKDKIDFKKDYSRILVGGSILDRGFTVEGLNVTYMPRNVGVGNADTLQQRCRFFGYKKKYFDLCRVYLPRESKRAYIDYITHEEDLRKKLKDFEKQKKSLKEFKREFILSEKLNITRKNVISDNVEKYKLKGWRPIDILDPNYKANNSVFEKFIENQNFSDYLPVSKNATVFQKHEKTEISSSDLITDLLLPLSFSDPKNSILINHFISALRYWYSNSKGGDVCLINISKEEKRQRSLDENDKIKNLMQGSDSKTNYPGDRNIKSDKGITVQLHNIEIINNGNNLRTLTIHFPSNFSHNIITLKG